MALAPLAHSPNKSKAPVPYFLWKNHKFPRTKKVTYANFICNIRPQKTETHHVRMAAGGDKLDYPSNASSPAVSMLGAKIHTNSTISDAPNGTRYLGLDIKNFYLGTPMTYFQYIQVRPSVIPQEVWDGKRVTTSPSPPTATSISESGVVCTASKKLASLLSTNLPKIRSFRIQTNGLHPWTLAPPHETNHIALCVDDFGVRYFSVPDALHLINAVKSNYNLAIHWSGPLYCDLILNCHYDEGYAHVSMPGYIDRALTKFAYPVPLRPQHALHKWIQPAYGSGKPQRPAPKSTA
jgi:hypothetical protein